MKRYFQLATVFFLTLTFGRALPAAGIVFAAKYYGKSSEAYSHLYKINPDGRGQKQITSGKVTDTNPLWSPDGKKILFHREFAGRKSLCFIPAEGGAISTVASGFKKMGDYGWSADGKVIAHTADGYLNIYEIANKKTFKLFKASHLAISPGGHSIYASCDDSGRFFDIDMAEAVEVSAGRAVWLSNTLAVINPPGTYDLEKFTHKGASLGRVTVELELEDGSTADHADRLYRVPGNTKTPQVIYARYAGNNSIGTKHIFYLANIDTGEARKLTSGLNLAWSPDGKRFITGSARTPMMVNQKKKVTSGLWIYSLQTDKKSALVTGEVYITGFDWR